jgi:phosphoribosylaminoimidazolecarboxamide formyltransferase/IMP cyclohydrolase
MPRALLSVSDKTGIVDFARNIAARGYELVSTGGTARRLAEAGLRVVGVSEITGFPEMMDGRVKTLHPALHGGILARRDRAEDLAALDRLGIGLVDVVVVNLYPFAQAAANPATPFDVLVEEIDIGGPSLVRAAAKNFRDVLVVVDPTDYPDVLKALDSGLTLAFRFALMRKAFAHTAAYDATIAETLEAVDLDNIGFVRRDDSETLGQHVQLSLDKIRDLRYGENPHQRAAWFATGARGFSRAINPERELFSRTPAGFGHATILQGKELSYTNLLDLDAAARITLEFDGQPAAAVVKHTNPCGAAVGESLSEAYVRARDADRLAAFGGIVALSRPIDVATAEEIVSTFIEAVVAPSVDANARDVLARKTNMRVVIADFHGLGRGGLELRSILGATLAQDRDMVLEARQPWGATTPPEGVRVVTMRKPTPNEWEALRFGWRLSAHVKSNAVVFTDERRTLAIGAGQMSRVDAVNVAIMKAAAANRSLSGSVAASDAFFPFRDGLDRIAGSGATAVIQPGGSVRDAEVIAAADEAGLAMVFTGRRHFRH